MQYNLLMTVFTQINSVADFLQMKYTFRRQTAILRFKPHWGLAMDNIRCLP